MASLLRRGESVESGDLTDIDRYIARARTVLSLLALVSIYLDPVVGGPFTLELLALVVLGLHLAYSVATMLLTAHFGSSPRAARMCEALDVLFATAVALVTEGLNSPSYVFFCFAIVAAGCREGRSPGRHVLRQLRQLRLVRLVARGQVGALRIHGRRGPGGSHSIW